MCRVRDGIERNAWMSQVLGFPLSFLSPLTTVNLLNLTVPRETIGLSCLGISTSMVIFNNTHSRHKGASFTLTISYLHKFLQQVKENKHEHKGTYETPCTYGKIEKPALLSDRTFGYHVNIGMNQCCDCESFLALSGIHLGTFSSSCGFPYVADAFHGKLLVVWVGFRTASQKWSLELQQCMKWPLVDRSDYLPLPSSTSAYHHLLLKVIDLETSSAWDWGAVIM